MLSRSAILAAIPVTGLVMLISFLAACGAGTAPAASLPAIATENPCAHLPSGWSCETTSPAAQPPVNRPAVVAYLKAHPAPARKGMTAGIIVGFDEPVICQAPSAASRGSDVQRGFPCLQYEAEIEVLGGSVRALTCTDLDTAVNAVSCSTFSAEGLGDVGNIDLGDYVYFPSSGVTAGPGVQFIKRSAVEP